MKTSKTKIRKVILGVFSITSIGFMLSLPNNFDQNSTAPAHINFSPTGRPIENLSKEELQVNKRNLERRKQALTNNSLKSTSTTNLISGTWEQMEFLSTNQFGLGHRVDGSIYDRENDIIYAVSFAGHIYRIDRDESDPSNTQWSRMNHSENHLAYIDGINLGNGAFRMIRSAGTAMEFSDDEGRTWKPAQGISTINKSWIGGHAPYGTNGNRIAVACKTSENEQKLFFSTDYGENYFASNLSFNPTNNELRIMRPAYSDTLYLFQRDKATSKINIYKCSPTDNDFTLISSPNFNFKGLKRVFGTHKNGATHFYIGGTNAYIYYSGDGGMSWTTTNSSNSGDGDIVPRTVHPDKPNTIFKGYLDVYISQDFGATFTNFSHRLGWDVHQMKMYRKKDGSYFHFVGKDFGCYLSYEPENKDSYIQLNNTSPAQMCYDACSSQEYNCMFSAMQDRGTQGFKTSKNQTLTHDVRGTDGLRVTVANNGASVWTWMYFGSMYHKSNFAATASPLTSINFTGKWWAAPMVPSPNPNEDAVVIPIKNKLQKFTHNPVQKEIITSEHYFDFSKLTNQPLTGFAYSKINRNKWFVSAKDGSFFYSEDGGFSFTKASILSISPKANDATYNFRKVQHVIKTSKLDQNKVYYAGVGNVFLISNDGGKTFTNHNKNLDVYRVREFALSSDEKLIFAACALGGAWVYSADTDEWQELTAPALPYVDYTNVEFIAKENTVRFATFGSGVLNFRLNVPADKIKYPTQLKVDSVFKNRVTVSWKDNSLNEDGFAIERLEKGIFKTIATTNANDTVFTDLNLNRELNFVYRVKAFNATSESQYSNYTLANAITYNGVVDRKNWKVIYTSSEEKNPGKEAPGSNAIDGDPTSIWHTAWYQVNPKPSHPHSIVIDMMDTLELKVFSYLTRQDGILNGSIKDFDLFVTTDTNNWGKPVASGSWAKDDKEKQVIFPAPKTGRFFKLVAKSEVNGNVFAACSEINVFTEIPVPTIPRAPQIIQAGAISDSEMEIHWLDLSNSEEAYIVEQLVDNKFYEVRTLAANSTKFIRSGLTKNTTYTFRVAAKNSIGVSEYSDTVTLFFKSDELNNCESANDQIALIYPIPAKKILNIQLKDNPDFTTWKVYNLAGQIIKQGEITPKQKHTISIGELSPGRYILHLCGKNMRYSKSFIKTF